MEDKMKEFEKKFAQVKIEDLKKTYNEECDDVRRVLRKMYPEIFRSDKLKNAKEEIRSIECSVGSILRKFSGEEREEIDAYMTYRMIGITLSENFHEVYVVLNKRFA